MIRTEQIDQGRVHGLIAHAEKPRGGIVLLPTIFGVDRFSQGRANLLAEAGYTTLIWNPYPGEGAPTEYPVAQAKAGRRVIIVAGLPLGTPGATNMVRIAFVGSEMPGL